MEIPETGYAMTAERRVDRVPSRRVRAGYRVRPLSVRLDRASRSISCSANSARAVKIGGRRPPERWARTLGFRPPYGPELATKWTRPPQRPYRLRLGRRPRTRARAYSPCPPGPESAAVIWANCSRQGLAKFMRIGLPPAGRWYRNQLHVLAGVASVIDTPDRSSDGVRLGGSAVRPIAHRR